MAGRRSTRSDTSSGHTDATTRAPITLPPSARTRRRPFTRWSAAAAAVAAVAVLLATQPNPFEPMVVAAASARAALRLTGMRFFRDVSRAKAHRRLHHDSHALVAMLMGRERPLTVKEPDHTTAHFTGAELSFFDGRSDPAAPLYLAIRGRVYDVTAGAKHYGVGRSYHCFVGKDATRAFGTGCLEEECLVASTVGLTSAQLREVQRWVELYEFHDKYTFVGVVAESPVEDVVARAMLEHAAIQALQQQQARAGPDEPAIAAQSTAEERVSQLRADAAARYGAGDVDAAVALWGAALMVLGESTSSTAAARAEVLMAKAAALAKLGLHEQALSHTTEALDGMRAAWGEQRSERHVLVARALADSAVFRFAMRAPAAAAEGLAHAAAVYQRALDVGPPHQPGGEDGEGGEGGQGGQAEVVQEHAQLQGVDVVQVKRELVNTWSNLVRALVATGRSADLDLAHATLQRQRNYLRSGDVQEEDARTFEALSAPLYAQVERAITSRDAAAAAASK